jgi:LuxR family maltose regulon positive regulatory protein
LSLREGWRTSYLVTATRLAQHYLELKQTDKCLALAHSILEKERCWEAGYRLLMQAHIQDGRSAQATRVYDLCSEILRQELGVEPSDETEELFATALRA